MGVWAGFSLAACSLLAFLAKLQPAASVQKREIDFVMCVGGEEEETKFNIIYILCVYVYIWCMHFSREHNVCCLVSIVAGWDLGWGGELCDGGYQA